MKIQCPHGCTIKVEETYGVIIYKHPNGDPCHLMNGFNTTMEHVLGAYAGSKHGKAKDIALNSSPIARMHLYEKLAAITDREKMTEALLEILPLMKENWREAYRTLGVPLITNLSALLHYDRDKFARYTDFYDFENELKRDSRKCEWKPKFEMKEFKKLEVPIPESKPIYNAFGRMSREMCEQMARQKAAADFARKQAK